MKTTIRRARADEAGALSVLAARLFEQTYRDSIPPAELSAHVSGDFGEAIQRGEIADPETVSLVVEGGGELLGFAQLRRREIPEGSSVPASVELWRIYLDRRCHGLGVGRALLTEVGKAARELDATGVWLSVWEKNPRAIAFYERNGFTTVGSQPFRVGAEIQRDLLMQAPSGAF